MWEIRGIIAMCLSVSKNQPWEGMAQGSGDHSVRQEQNVEEMCPF